METGKLERIILGVSPAVRSLRAEIEALARQPLRALLVQGETGAGKELVPQALLACLYDGRAPLEVFHCPAVPADHLESELFGTMRCAYPGAVDRAGAAERADTGILFLDEIAAMPAAHQAKVLRLLESREARRLGASRPYRTSAVMVAATNEDLPGLVEAGRFRADLYHRLVQDGVLRVPPLRERIEDLAILGERFLSELHPPPCLSEDGLSELRSYTWPGNVRELRAVLRTAARLAGAGSIGGGEVREALRRIGAPSPASDALDPSPPPAASFQSATESLRRKLLLDALARAGGNLTLAGLLLGLHRRSRAAPRGFDLDGIDLMDRKRAHRKFKYWWLRLVDNELVPELRISPPIDAWPQRLPSSSGS